MYVSPRTGSQISILFYGYSGQCIDLCWESGVDVKRFRIERKLKMRLSDLFKKNGRTEEKTQSTEDQEFSLTDISDMERINPEEYFCRFLGYRMDMIGNQSFGANCYFESYCALDDKFLSWLAEHENNPGAWDELGQRMFFGNKDINKAIEYLTKASELGNGDSTMLLAQVYRDHLKDYDMYFRQLEKACRQGCGMAMFNLACCFYKGKDAYDGHGYDQNKKKALELSMVATDRIEELLTVMTSVKCSRSFQEYFSQQVRCYVQCVCISAEQLIDGDGVAQDLNRAKQLLLKSNEFYKSRFGEECADFGNLLREIDRKMQ